MDDGTDALLRRSEVHFLLDEDGDSEPAANGSAILVLDYRALTGDMDPVATLTQLAIDTCEEMLLFRPERLGPAN
ncbi:MAG: hypothetical protein CL928_17875 [Deltaproteobacteria bacterium]|nr:hypothetical protein [Deltaproteobacteria bacterium]